jgi:hypothetical protein
VDAVLPVAVLEAMPEHPDEIAQREAEARRAAWAAEKASRTDLGDYERMYALKALDDECGKLSRTADGDRHDQNYRSAYAMGQLVGAGALGESEAYNAVLDAALSAGRNRADAVRTTRDGLDAGMKSPRDIPPPKEKEKKKRGKRKDATPAAAAPVSDSSGIVDTPVDEEQPLRLADQVKDVALRQVQPDLRVNLRYISDVEIAQLERFSALMIKSALGTGKTELVPRLLARLRELLGYEPRALIITHRTALAKNIANRLNFECYKELDSKAMRSAGVSLRDAPQLVISFDSLWKIAVVKEALPKYDIVVVDEINQFMPHLAGGTMKGSEPERAYKVLRQVVKEARLFVGLDAHLTDTPVEFVRQLRAGGPQSVGVIVNDYVVQRGKLTIHANISQVIRRAIELIDEEAGPVVIPVGTKNLAKRLYRMMGERYGKDAVRVIHGHNSESRESQQFIARINAELPKLRVLIYSSSLGTGIDITSPVRGVCALFPTRPHTPADYHQMIMRCRQADERHVWVQRADGSTETKWEEIYRLYEGAAMATAGLCEFDDYGVLAVTSIHKAMLKLLAKLQAERNEQSNDPLSYFVALAKHEGYEIDFSDAAEDDSIKADLSDAGRKVKAEEKEGRRRAKSISHDEYQVYQQAGNVTDEIRYGHDRYKIEDVVGLEWTDQLDDDLESSQKREALRRFADLETPAEELKAKDRAEASTPEGWGGVLLMKRKHFTMQAELINEALRLVYRDGLDDGCKIPLRAEDIEERLGDFAQRREKELMRALGWRSNQSRNAVPLLRWMLGRVGLRLNKARRMVNGARVGEYWLDEETLDKQRAYAAARLEHLENKRRDEAKKRPAQNLHLEYDRTDQGDVYAAWKRAIDEIPV